MSYDLSEYVDVAERIRVFKDKYPDGCLQSELDFEIVAGAITGVTCRAYAFRTADDERPGIGHAYEPIPGLTSFTKYSEVQNAETSAWGRAIVALGFETKKIASRQEVLNRSGAGTDGTGRENPELDTPHSDAGSAPAPDNPAEQARLAQEAARAARTPDDDGKPENVVLTFGKHKGTTIGNAPRAYVEWLVDNHEPKTAEQRRIHTAAQLVLTPAADPYPDVPFQ